MQPPSEEPARRTLPLRSVAEPVNKRLAHLRTRVTQKGSQQFDRPRARADPLSAPITCIVLHSLPLLLESRALQVWVRMMAGRNIEFSGIHADDLVDKILLGIYDRENIPVDQLRLVCPLSHYELEPGSELFVYGITGDWTLHMVRMLRGDGPERRSRPIMPQTELEPAEPFVPATFSPAP